MNNLTKEEEFARTLACVHVRKNDPLSEHVDVLFSVKNRTLPSTTWIALEDFYYVDQQILVPKGQTFHWRKSSFHPIRIMFAE